MPRTLGIRAICLFATVLLTGCAQPSAQVTGIEKVPDFIPTDRWEAGAGHKNAGVATESRDAVFIIACSSEHPSPTLLVDPMAMPQIATGARTVTIIFDNEAPLAQSWIASQAGYGISAGDAGFAADIEKLKAHHRVEVVLSDEGKELDRHSFTLNGAAQAIDTVVGACAK